MNYMDSASGAQSGSAPSAQANPAPAPPAPTPQANPAPEPPAPTPQADPAPAPPAQPPQLDPNATAAMVGYSTDYFIPPGPQSQPYH